MTNSKNKIIKNLRSTYCRLGPSKIQGVGVVAIREIPKDTKVFSGILDQRWYKFKMSELEGLDEEILRMIDDFFVIEEDKTVKIPESALNGMDPSFFVNNSKNPNLKTKDGYTFITKRKIKKGEELTVSYSSYDYKYK